MTVTYIRAGSSPNSYDPIFKQVLLPWSAPVSIKTGRHAPPNASPARITGSGRRTVVRPPFFSDNAADGKEAEADWRFGYWPAVGPAPDRLASKAPTQAPQIPAIKPIPGPACRRLFPFFNVFNGSERSCESHRGFDFLVIISPNLHGS